MIFQTPFLTMEDQIALERIDGLRRALRYFLASKPNRWVGSIRRLLAARAIRASNSIEGYNVSVEDALAAVEGGEPTDPTSDDWRAVLSYQRAMTYVLQLSEDPHFEYTAQLLRSLHFMMTEGSIGAGPGLWRPGSIWVKNDATGDIVYEAPDTADVPGLIKEVMETLTTDGDTPSTVRAAMAHLNLTMIHPFRDGNGRMSRCLQTLVLARHGIIAPELCSIEEYLGLNTDSYYAILGEVGQGQWSPTADAGPWVRYCLAAHYVQGSLVMRRLNEWNIIGEHCEALVQTQRLPSRVVGILGDAALGLRVRNSLYRTRLERAIGETVSNQVASRDLHEMVKAGLLVAHGSRRGTSYSAGPPLVEIRMRIHEQRTPIEPADVFKPA
jgi:Fic family protein